MFQQLHVRFQCTEERYKESYKKRQRVILAECRITLHLLISSAGYRLQPADYKVYFILA
jgi:hypothetical protein